MPLPKQIDTETLLRDSKPGMPGVFFLSKIEFVELPPNGEYGDRCDNFTFTSVRLTKDTEYENNEISLFKSKNRNNAVDEKKDGISYKKVVRYESAIDCAPDFAIVYIEFAKIEKTQSLYSLEKITAPATMWYGRSLFQLLKNMREWQFAKNELLSENPMALYSDIAMNRLNPPPEIIKEIDEWPDMHLAMFLKGNQDYRVIPHPYPSPSSEMIEWVVSMSEKYKKQTDEEIMERLKLTES